MNKENIAKLCISLGYNMRELLVHFNIPFEDLDDRLMGVCPIHDGADSTTGFTVDLEEGEYFGCWRCWTRGCEKHWLHSPLGLVRALLSAERGKKITFNEAVRFSSNFIKMDKTELHKKSKTINFEKRKRLRVGIQVPREKVRKSLARPVDYFLKRGYKAEVLDLFDVGACWERGKSMYGRAVAPVYDQDFKNMIGCVGRVMHENYEGNKWINSKNFNSGSHLYGYWLTKDGIRSTRTVILVEGQGDVWRLWEAGIKNAVGIFGSNLSDAQCRILETSGALNIVILTDNDESGEKARSLIKEKSDRLFNIFEPTIENNDVGDMTIQEINDILKPQLQGHI
mgnify:FL=1